MNKEILQRVLSCLQKVKYIPAINIDYDKPLTGDTIQFSAIDMTYLLLEIMQEFNIKFNASDVSNYGFNTIRKIVSTIEKISNYAVQASDS